MKEFKIEVPVREYSYAELPEEDRRLVDAAKEATANALPTYSHFSVGAAILLEDGTIVTGANQENAAFPSSMCAERTAAYWASANHPGKAIRKIAIAANTFRLNREPGASFAQCFQRNPIAPCGACRQALLEYEHLYGPMEVILYGADRTFVLPSVASLLPVTFTDF